MIRILNKVIEKELSNKVICIERFFTGHCNYVYYVKTKDKQYIFRLKKGGKNNINKGSLYWLEKLKHLNINIPKVISSGNVEHYQYIILTYIEGEDLHYKYKDLSSFEKKH